LVEHELSGARSIPVSIVVFVLVSGVELIITLLARISSTPVVAEELVDDSKLVVKTPCIETLLVIFEVGSGVAAVEGSLK